MYSTLLFLDKPRHLRYDILAVVDLDQLIPGGFKSIFKMKVNMDSLKIIFWAGLKHEDKDLDLNRVETILTSVLDKGWTEEKLIEIFSRTIWDQGWLSKSQDKTDKPFTIENLILDMEKVNYKYLHFQPRDFYALTPQEFIKILDVWNDKEDRDLALLCVTTAQCAGATKTGGVAFTIDDFIPQKSKPQQSADQMKNILMNAFGG